MICVATIEAVAGVTSICKTLIMITECCCSISEHLSWMIGRLGGLLSNVRVTSHAEKVCSSLFWCNGLLEAASDWPSKSSCHWGILHQVGCSRSLCHVNHVTWVALQRHEMGSSLARVGTHVTLGELNAALHCRKLKLRDWSHAQSLHKSVLVLKGQGLESGAGCVLRRWSRWRWQWQW